MTDENAQKSQARRWERRVRLVDEVASELRTRIYEGWYSPGSVIHQENVSAELGISRTPLREAIRMLEQEGLLIAEPGRGARVVAASRATLLDAYELRSVVDGLAARLATVQMDETDIAELEGIVAAQEDSLDPWVPANYTKLNIAFHELILRATKNEFLIAQIVLLRMTAQIFNPSMGIPQSVAINAIRQHGAILAAIRDRDAVLSEQLARHHIETTMKRLRGQENGEANRDLTAGA